MICGSYSKFKSREISSNFHQLIYVKRDSIAKSADRINMITSTIYMCMYDLIDF